jgi:hypothetical protein
MNSGYLYHSLIRRWNIPKVYLNTLGMYLSYHTKRENPKEETKRKRKEKYQEKTLRKIPDRMKEKKEVNNLCIYA